MLIIRPLTLMVLPVTMVMLALSACILRLQSQVMNLSGILSILTLFACVPTIKTLQLIPNFLHRGRFISPLDWREQRPIMDIPIPPFNAGQDASKGADEVIISDVLGIERTINVFASFIRGIESVSTRLENSEQNTTVLAPVNSQIQQLPRKPWEDPKDYEVLGEQAYDGSSGEDRAQRNLRKFVESHIVPVSPWKEGEKVASLGGGKLWWEEKDGQRLVSSSVISPMPHLLLTTMVRFTQEACKFYVLQMKLQTERCGS